MATVSFQKGSLTLFCTSFHFHACTQTHIMISHTLAITAGDIGKAVVCGDLEVDNIFDFEVGVATGTFTLH